MPKKLILCAVALVGVLLGAFYFYPWEVDPVDPQEESVGKPDDSPISAGLPRSAEFRAEDPATEPAGPSERQAVDSDGSFTLESTQKGSDRPLAGVHLTLTSVSLPQRRHEAISGMDGVARIDGVVHGRYWIEASHDAFVPCGSPLGRKSVVWIPGPTARCQWVPVYAFGWKAIGSDTLAPDDRVRFTTGTGIGNRRGVTGQSVWRISERLRARWGNTVQACVPYVAPSLSTRITIFDKKKGPCEFELPIVPVAEFCELTVCDLSNRPVVEAMACLTIQVVDELGQRVDIGRLKARRSKAYHGFKSDYLAANASHFLPPGVYWLSTKNLSYPWKHRNQKIRLYSGKSAVTRILLPHRMRQVELTVPGPGAIAQIKHADGYARRINIRGKHRMWLPEGVTTFAFLYVVKGAAKSNTVHRDIKVEPVPGIQRIAVSLD